MQIRGMNVIITPISSQLTHFKQTSQVVHLKCTLKISILLQHFPSSLHSQNALSVMFLKTFSVTIPTESISPATTPSEEDTNI